MCFFEKSDNVTESIGEWPGFFPPLEPLAKSTFFGFEPTTPDDEPKERTNSNCLFALIHRKFLFWAKRTSRKLSLSSASTNKIFQARVDVIKLFRLFAYPMEMGGWQDLALGRRRKTPTQICSLFCVLNSVHQPICSSSENDRYLFEPLKPSAWWASGEMLQKILPSGRSLVIDFYSQKTRIWLDFLLPSQSFASHNNQSKQKALENERTESIRDLAGW